LRRRKQASRNNRCRLRGHTLATKNASTRFHRRTNVELCLGHVYIELWKPNLAKIMADQLNQESVNDTAKLLMHRIIARSLARDPSLVGRARSSLAAMARRFPDRTFVTEWESLLRLPVCSLRNLLTSRDQQMRRLRLSSPFVTAEGVDFTDDALRRRIGRAAKRLAARPSMRPDRGASAFDASEPTNLFSSGN
jgi:hypothetical protein